MFPEHPLDVPLRYSRRLSVFLIVMAVICAAVIAAVGSIDDGDVPVIEDCYRC